MMIDCRSRGQRTVHPRSEPRYRRCSVKKRRIRRHMPHPKVEKRHSSHQLPRHRKLVRPPLHAPCSELTSAGRLPVGPFTATRDRRGCEQVGNRASRAVMHESIHTRVYTNSKNSARPARAPPPSMPGGAHRVSTTSSRNREKNGTDVQGRHRHSDECQPWQLCAGRGPGAQADGAAGALWREGVGKANLSVPLLLRVEVGEASTCHRTRRCHRAA